VGRSLLNRRHPFVDSRVWVLFEISTRNTPYPSDKGTASLKSTNRLGELWIDYITLGWFAIINLLKQSITGLDMKDFYKKFQIVSKFPLWPSYLRQVYKKAIVDALALGIGSLQNRASFTCLLCGVSGEITANEFIKFALKLHPKCKIMVIDLGEPQVNSVKQLVAEKFSEADIEIRRANALNLDFIQNNSIDWIDTDGFFSFFDKDQLVALFKEWKRILRKDGFITFRELTSDNVLSISANKFRDRVSRVYINTKLHLHTFEELKKDFATLQFKYARHHSPIPFLERYCLLNE